MTLYIKESKLADMLMAYPQLIPVVNRLGVNLGVSDFTVVEACKKKNIDPVFFLSVVNTFIDPDYFPTDIKGSFTLSKTVEYIRKTNAFYRHVQLPNIERHFHSLIEKSGKNNNLDMLYDFFLKMKRHLENWMSIEEKEFFSESKNKILSSDFDAVINGYADSEERIHDLLFFFVSHLKGEYDKNLCMAVVSSLSWLDADFKQNNRIRNRILVSGVDG